jgi:putative addiction module component (TIGR02574 family)
MIDPRDLLQEAMKLPPEARAALAGSLLESLDTEVDANAEAAWAVEIERRLREIEQGTATTVSWDEVRRRIGR